MKRYYFIYILFTLLWSYERIHAQVSSLNQADHAYKQFQFKEAAKKYEQLLINVAAAKKMSIVVRDSIVFKLADCYWQMREYAPSHYWYSKLPASYHNLSEVIRRRGEWEAMNKLYDKASFSFSALAGWQEKSKGFSSVDNMSKDSADWRVSYLSLNEQGYREFSPMLLDSTLVWTTNERKSEWVPKVLGWDGFRYTHVLKSIDTFTFSTTLLTRPVWDSVVYIKGLRAKKLAQHFTNADNDHLMHISGISSRSLANKKGYTPLSLEGTNDLKFNVAHTSYSPKTGKIYMNVNKSYTNDKDDIRLITIAEGKWDNGKVVDIRKLELVDSGYMALHPAIHPDGDVLVFSSDKIGGKGGYDLYYSTLLDEGKWATPKALTELNTPGNEVFARFTPSGNLVFSSDGMSGYGGLDLYEAQFSNMNLIRKDHFPSPINSSYDDFGWTQYANGKRGFFSSDRLGDDDIYLFSFEPKWASLSGKLINRKDSLPLAGVNVKLIELLDNEIITVVDSLISNNEGEYTFKTKPNHRYRIDIVNEDRTEQALALVDGTNSHKNVPAVLVGKENEQITNSPPEIAPAPEWVVDADIRLSDREKGAVYKSELNSWLKRADTVFMVHHYFDRVTVIKEDKQILKNVEALLNENPQYRLYIVSATDCMASEAYNNELSYRRSNHVASTYKAKHSNSIRRYWISERNLLIPCSKALFNVSRQVENRYTYLILIKE